MTYVRGASIVLDNLVLALDAGNIKSFRGEPTTNYVGSNGYGYNPLDLYTWSSNGSTSVWSRDSSVTSPVGGIPVKEISSGTDSYSSTYNTIPFNLCPCVIGQIWTISIYVKSSVGTNLQLWFFESNSAGNYVLADYTQTTSTGDWQRLEFTRTITTGEFIQTRVATATNGAIIWWDGLQVEQKDHASTFANGSRGTTVASSGGWKDLSGSANHGEIISFPKYDSENSGSLLYDGVDDYINIPVFTNKPINQITCEAWIFPTKASASGSIRGGAISCTNSMYLGIIDSTDGGNTFSLHWANQTSDSRLNNWNGNIPNNQWTHIVGTYDGTSTRAYINCVEVWNAAQTGIVSDGTYVIGTYGGALQDGFHNFKGKIPISRIYDRALSLGEIKQNYNANKSRFNLE